MEEKSSAKARDEFKRLKITVTVYKEYLYNFLSVVMKKPIE